MDDQVEAVLMKSGEQRIRISLTRSPLSPLLVNIWARPEVEDFMRLLGTGEQQDVQTLGRYWTPHGINKQERKLYVYELSQLMGPLTVGDLLTYRLDLPGQPLTIRTENDRPFGGGGGEEVLNMSFLRCVGISGPNGVSFSVAGVFERKSIDRLGKYIELATQKFYRELLKPYKLIVGVYTMPVPIEAGTEGL